jgi:hypothetical protein
LIWLPTLQPWRMLNRTLAPLFMAASVCPPWSACTSSGCGIRDAFPSFDRTDSCSARESPFGNSPARHTWGLFCFLHVSTSLFIRSKTQRICKRACAGLILLVCDWNPSVSLVSACSPCEADVSARVVLRSQRLTPPRAVPVSQSLSYPSALSLARSFSPVLPYERKTQGKGNCAYVA